MVSRILISICVLLAWTYTDAPFASIEPLNAVQIQEPARSGEPRVDALGDPLPSQAIRGYGTKRFMHAGSVAQAIYSGDGKAIITYGRSQLIAWDIKTGKKIATQVIGGNLSAAGYGIRPLAVIPNSGNLAVAYAGRIVIWNWEANTLKDFATKNVGEFKSIDFSPDGRLCFAGGKTSSVVLDSQGNLLYRKPNRGLTPPLENQFNDNDRLKFGGDFNYGRFSPDGKALALVNSTNPTKIQLLVPETGESIRVIEAGARIVRMDFSPDGKSIVASERDNAVRLYDVESGKRRWEFVIEFSGTAESYTSDIAFRPDGKQIAVGAPIGSDYRIRLLDTNTGAETGALSGSGWKPWTVSYSADGKTLLGSGWDSIVRQWDVESQAELPLPGDATRASAACGMSPDGLHMAFVGKGGLHIVELATNKTVRKIAIQIDVQEPGQIVFSDDGTMVALGFSSPDDVHVKVWQVEDGAELHHFEWPKGRSPHSNTEAVCFSKNGKRLGASVFRQGIAYVFDLEKSETISVVKHPSVYGMDINSDGSIIVTAGWDQHVRTWDCDSGKQLKAIEVSDGKDNNGRNNTDTRMYGAKFSPDEKFIATCDMTHSIRFFDLELNEVKRIKDGGWFTFGAINYSRNGLWIGAGAGRGNIRKNGSITVFDVASGDEIWVALKKHEDYVYTVEFGARDRSILSGTGEGVCYIWDTQLPLNADDLDYLRTLDDDQNETDFQDLIGFSGPKAYAVYSKYLANPALACEIIKKHLSQADATNGNEPAIKKWIVALGATQPEMIAKAKQNLNLLGPTVCEQLAAQLKNESSTNEKKAAVESLLHSIPHNYRRATILLAELETEQSDNAIEELLANSKSERMKRLLREAQEHRATFFKIGK